MKLFLFAIFILISLNVVAGWPFILNVTNGNFVVTDLNSSNNMTTNLTIYVYNYNNTFYNFTNITTYQNITNVTCINCSMNYTNYYSDNSSSNLSNSNFYNKSEADALFTRRTEMQTYQGTADGKFTLKTDFDSLKLSVDTLNTNMTALNDEAGGSHNILWIVLIIIGLIAVIAIVMAMTGAGG